MTGTFRAAHKWSSACLCLMQWFLLHSAHTKGISPCWRQLFKEHLLLFFGLPITRLLQPLRMCFSTWLLMSSSLDFFIIWLQIGQTGTWTSVNAKCEHWCSSGVRCSKQKTSLQWEHWNGKKSSRLHDAKLQCFPIESRSASSAMMELWFQRTYSSFWSAVYIHSAESWCESGKITFPDSSKETKVVLGGPEISSHATTADQLFSVSLETWEASFPGNLVPRAFSMAWGKRPWERGWG